MSYKKKKQCYVKEVCSWAMLTPNFKEPALSCTEIFEEYLSQLVSKVIPQYRGNE